MLLGGKSVGRVVLGLGVEVDVTVLGGTVRAGRLVALTSGDAAVMVTLAVAEQPVAHSQPHTIHLAMEVSLGEGIKLSDPQLSSAGPGRT